MMQLGWSFNRITFYLGCFFCSETLVWSISSFWCFYSHSSEGFLNVNLDLSRWLREVGSVLSTLVFTRQCTAGATVEALDDTQCRLVRANRGRRSSSSGTVFDRRQMTREKIPREQYGSDELRIDYQGRGIASQLRWLRL